MAGLAAAVRSFPDKLPPIVLALLTGLNAAAVGLIALAAYQLSNGAVTDAVSRIVLVACASFGICYHAPWVRRGMDSGLSTTGADTPLARGDVSRPSGNRRPHHLPMGLPAPSPHARPASEASCLVDITRHKRVHRVTAGTQYDAR